jgi:tetratricopeptide (TPR) repeat protein
MKSRDSNLVHMASADHRIPLRPEGSDQEFSMPSGRWLIELERSPESALFLFPEGQSHDPSIWHSGHPNREMARDSGLALMDLAGLKVPQSLRRRLAENALPLLTSSLESWPDDVPAGQGKGYALWLLDRKLDALAAFEQTLAAAPRREETLVYAAAVAAQLGQTDSAIKLWRRAVDVNPWSPRSHYELAKLLAHQQQWAEALSQAEKALDLDPFQSEAQLLRIECRLELGQTERAGKELNDLVRSDPAKARDLKRWFDERRARARIEDR